MQITNRVLGSLSVGGRLTATLENARGTFQQRLLSLMDHRRLSVFARQTPVGPRWTSYVVASSDTVRSPFSAYSATRALNAASWFLRFDMF